MYDDKSIIDLEKEIANIPQKVVLTGDTLTINEIIAVARYNVVVEFTDDPHILRRVTRCYEQMMQDVENGIPIYGCNTGYGARASHVLTAGTKRQRVQIGKQFSESIVHVDVSVGPTFTKDIVRAAMLIRINMLLKGVSAVKLEDLEIYRQMLNKDIIPVVHQYGGIGASGDLAHNGRVLSAARWLPGSKVWDKKGEIVDAKNALKKAGISQLLLDPKAGLGLVNGDNFSTAVATLLYFDTLQAMIVSTVTGAMMIEVLKGSDRSFHPLLAAVRPHAGQKEIAMIYRFLLNGSKLAYQEMKGHKLREKGIKVQDGYSLRCISQYMAVNVEKMKHLIQTITINANSASDNPLWVLPEYATEEEKPWQWVSGGNFIAMHMVEAMDALRKTMTQMVKLHDRHLARLVSPHENNGLPANLSDEQAVSRCTFKAVQIQSGMFEVYSSLLSIPVSTFFGVHEEGNQDITSHALTSGILGMENLQLVRYSLAQNLLAIIQAVDIRGGAKLLAPQTKHVYKALRTRTKYITKEQPLNTDIEYIFQQIENGELNRVIRENVFSTY